ncbi:hypothetical protein V1281_006400 [Nitrobacteraceae bacterium AZCC 2161]
MRDGLVDFKARFHEDEVRALATGGDRWHRRTDAELSGFVARCSHNVAFAGSSDGHRLAAQLRIVALLDGSVEGVHVDMDDLALAGRISCAVERGHIVRMVFR